ncbi:hypothetical protein WOLCODRAFT_83009 [Wolfiporia cocos MD-104 SS10]|uniref:Uncharacterized protein n=1 Tax=Wolfiporia cocos (strain MD-104) TaxID=742152 RepID=A0A2H3J3W7_WOLCO|nr:hypothetical protein WOLCODRAFT_83009 [Wolfiporia cocos MD-104 SS10]
MYSQDADIIVFTDDDQEYLKQLLVGEDSSFYLRRPRDRQESYKKLYYRLPSPQRGPKRMCKRKCKVDVLVPGKMRIPDMPQRHIMRQGGFPILQILPLLLLKLQGWNDHRHYPFGDYRRKKIPADVDDITGLLEIACNRGTHLGSKSLRWLPEKTVDASRKRVKWYVKKYPESAQKWERLGFDAYR